MSFYYGWKDLPFANFFEKRIVLYPTFKLTKNDSLPKDSSQPKSCPSFTQLLDNSELSTVGKTHLLSTYLADKQLATKEWLQEHKEEMITYLDKRINHGYSATTQGGHLVYRISSRLDFCPDFILKQPSLNPETGSVELHEITRKIGDTKYKLMVLNYLKEMINNPEKIDRLVYNDVYENELARQKKVRLINLIIGTALAVFFFALIYRDKQVQVKLV